MICAVSFERGVIIAIYMSGDDVLLIFAIMRWKKMDEFDCLKILKD